MTITHEPVHILIHRPLGKKPQPRPTVHTSPPRADVRSHPRTVGVDTTFWQHQSIFAGSQEQLNQLRGEAEERAAARGRAMFAGYLESLRAKDERPAAEAHRPVFKRLKPVIHVGFIPLLWTITTCRCGQRWPCNDIKQHLRREFGWTADMTEHLKTLTDQLPKPATRWIRLRRLFTRRRTTIDQR